jgi:hypothetical protein
MFILLIMLESVVKHCILIGMVLMEIGGKVVVVVV